MAGVSKRFLLLACRGGIPAERVLALTLPLLQSTSMQLSSNKEQNNSFRCVWPAEVSLRLRGGAGRSGIFNLVTLGLQALRKLSDITSNLI